MCRDGAHGQDRQWPECGAWPGLHLPRILFLATKLSTPVAWLELGAPTLLACCRVVVLTSRPRC